MFVVSKLDANIDPTFYHLQFSNSLGKDLSVSAKIRDLELWSKLGEEDSRISTRVKVKCGENWIITATVPSERFVEISKMANVISMQIATEVRPMNE